MISTRVHGMIDYLVGVLLIVAPYALGFADGTAAQFVPVLLGVFVIVYSLVTQYELSILKLIPISVHLILDAAWGLLLIASPWLFHFADVVWLPHVVVGIVDIGVVLLTQRRRLSPQMRTGS